MSELSVKVAREHGAITIATSQRNGTITNRKECACGASLPWGETGRAHITHVAAVTEAAVRETIAADIEALAKVADKRGQASALRFAATRIARGET